jgi:DNA-binding MarR family transcriptional regulator
MVLQYVEKHGEISRAEVADLCHISGPQAYRLLKKLEQKGHLTSIGSKGRGVKYERNTKGNARWKILMHSCISEMLFVHSEVFTPPRKNRQPG